MTVSLTKSRADTYLEGLAAFIRTHGARAAVIYGTKRDYIAVFTPWYNSATKERGFSKENVRVRNYHDARYVLGY